jgi:hypothetical protein
MYHRILFQFPLPAHYSQKIWQMAMHFKNVKFAYFLCELICIRKLHTELCYISRNKILHSFLSLVYYCYFIGEIKMHTTHNLGVNNSSNFLRTFARALLQPHQHSYNSTEKYI